ncbi:MAG TPA: L,D-transpeptidase family protein [Steroidobacteraceae bacterium]|nr:L,D-transpeptidase family protein [Steroidobacteraceae bacterium]
MKKLLGTPTSTDGVACHGAARDTASRDAFRCSVTAALVVSFIIGWAGSAHATVYPLPKNDDPVVGGDETVVTVYEDTLYDLARKYSLGSEELIRVNPGVDPWLPGAGKTLVIPNTHILPPGPREGIVVNLPEHRLYYYPKPKRGEQPQVVTYPVSIGKMDWRTPLGLTHVIQKIKNPVWYPPESVRKEHAAAGDPLPPKVPSGPDNPLGLFAMRLAAGNGTYLIHGTNNPIAVGLAVTHGCIRMYPQDVEALFPLVPVGTPVRLINEPLKVAWVDGELLLEAHPPVDAEGQSFEPDLDQFSDLLQKAVGASTVAIHWDYAREVLQKANGVIATVGLEADLPPEMRTPDAAPTADQPPSGAPAADSSPPAGPAPARESQASEAPAAAASPPTSAAAHDH